MFNSSNVTMKMKRMNQRMGNGMEKDEDEVRRGSDREKNGYDRQDRVDNPCRGIAGSRECQLRNIGVEGKRASKSH